jgi:acyl dehydratase
MPDKEYFEDCRVGERFVTPGRTITESDVVSFAALSGDWNSIHSDAEFAKTQPHGERIAHGMLSLVVGANLIFRLGQHAVYPKSLIAIASLDNVRFVQPVKIGDTLHLEAEIMETEKLRNGTGTIEFRYRIKNQANELVIAARVKIVAKCRPEAGASTTTGGAK